MKYDSVFCFLDPPSPNSSFHSEILAMVTEPDEKLAHTYSEKLN
jgi:hypothetical protein